MGRDSRALGNLLGTARLRNICATPVLRTGGWRRLRPARAAAPRARAGPLVRLCSPAGRAYPFPAPSLGLFSAPLTPAYVASPLYCPVPRRRFFLAAECAVLGP